ncbi:ABC transporter substrate-binding protein [Streptococcus catagoni]|uniref:ABC transporter substrate-binding protein n=1 Tax=Streptococcus catagoni TaxID=2654874 RepID=UPI0014094B7B|nr:ABC transporter substrate-binding protein [Streptococcus catagoni]
MRRKRILLFTLMALALINLGACRKSSQPKNGTVKIGIIQYAKHNALDAAQKGFIKALNQAGYKEGKNLTINRKNAQSDQSNLQTMAQQLAGKNDLNFAIATPAAQALKAADPDTPSVFTAVTDPLSAALVNSLEKPGSNMTGSNMTGSIDAGDIAQQMKLLTKLVPKAKTVGIFYNSSEVNSQTQAKAAQKILREKGLKVLVKTVTTTNDVQQVMTSLASQVDAIYLPTDNTVASTASTIGKILKDYKIPALGGDDAYLDAVLMTAGVDYRELGEKAGKQAVQILKGKKASAIPIEKPQKALIKINPDMAKSLGLDYQNLKSLAK